MFREKIKVLFEQGIDQSAIAGQLQDWEPFTGKDKKEREKIVSDIVISTVNEATRLSLVNIRRTERIVSLDRQLSDEERVKGKIVRGYIIWTPEEEEYFFDILVPDQQLRRIGGRINHERLAQEMNIHFGSPKFTSQTCMSKYRNRSRRD